MFRNSSQQSQLEPSLVAITARHVKEATLDPPDQSTHQLNTTE